MVGHRFYDGQRTKSRRGGGRARRAQPDARPRVVARAARDVGSRVDDRGARRTTRAPHPRARATHTVHILPGGSSRRHRVGAPFVAHAAAAWRCRLSVGRPTRRACKEPLWLALRRDTRASGARVDRALSTTGFAARGRRVWRHCAYVAWGAAATTAQHDEISLLVPEALEMINIQLQRLCGELDVPFGGVLILLAGDFTQKLPPNAISLAETLIATDVTQSNRKSRAIDPVSNRAKGLEHFRMARRTVLEKLMRADDVTFQEEQKQLRNSTVANPVPDSLLRDLRAISRQDLRSDPSWAFATICVLSNFERHHLNRLQAHNFAKIHDIPLVVWRRKIKNRWLDTCDENTINQLYENEPGAWEYFVRGAPAVLTANIQLTKYLTNGAVGVFHSLSLVPSQQHEEDRIKASGFARIELEQPPAIIYFQLELPTEDDGKDIQTLVSGVVVIPVVPSRNTFDYDSTSLFSCLNGVPKTLRCSTFTIYIQGSR